MALRAVWVEREDGRGSVRRAVAEVMPMSEFSDREGAVEPEDLGRLFLERANVGDVDGVVALYEPEAVLASPPGETATGRAAIPRCTRICSPADRSSAATFAPRSATETLPLPRRGSRGAPRRRSHAARATGSGYGSLICRTSSDNDPPAVRTSVRRNGSSRRPVGGSSCGRP